MIIAGGGPDQYSSNNPFRECAAGGFRVLAEAGFCAGAAAANFKVSPRSGKGCVGGSGSSLVVEGAMEAMVEEVLWKWRSRFLLLLCFS